MRNIFFFILTVIIMGCSQSEKPLTLPSLISDNMVLQADTEAKLWGWGKPGKTVEISASWGQTVKTKVDKSGSWLTSVSTPEHGGPYAISISSGSQNLTISNVLIGEVWLCSGQSNMEMSLSGWPPSDPIRNSAGEIANAQYPEIRMFTVKRSISMEPERDCSGNWQECNPKNAKDFSATAYFFGRKIHKELKVPVGLIHSSWGGTPAESWTEKKFLQKVPGYENVIAELQKGAEMYDEYKQQLSELKEIPFSDLPAERPFENLDLNDSLYLAKNLNVSNWKEMDIPSFWEESVLPDFDGVVWLRTEFEIPENVYPEGFELYLGPVDDMDATYVNGVKIGSNEIAGLWREERKYSIPASILKKGKNIAMIKVTDTGGGGGIYGAKNPAIYKGLKKIVDLAGKWKYKPAAVFTNNAVCVFDDNKTSYEDLPELKYKFNAHTPTVLYNAMIAPLLPYTIKGATWYQGESNVGRGQQYRTLFPTMINSWRSAWDQGAFPFYYVQIAPFDYGPNSDNDAAELREAQLMTLSEENTGMVVTMDIGNPKNIHPANKQDVGIRLSLWALANTYEKEGITFSGPIFRKAVFTGTNVELEFDFAENGLILGSDESFFEIAGEDQVYFSAKQKIEGQKLILNSPKVDSPIYVRYAWGDDVEPNLFNIEGFPASPFRVKK